MIGRLVILNSHASIQPGMVGRSERNSAWMILEQGLSGFAGQFHQSEAGCVEFSASINAGEADVAARQQGDLPLSSSFNPIVVKRGVELRDNTRQLEQAEFAHVRIPMTQRYTIARERNS